MFRLCSILVLTLSVLLVFGGCAKKVTEPVVEEPAPQVVEQEPVVETKPEPVVEKATAPDISDLGKVFFAYDSHNLSPEAKLALKVGAEWMKENADLKVTIEGHCDERGSDEYNMALGERRAQTVREYLANLGVSKGRLNAISYGEEQPATPGHDEVSWAKNRRVEFK